KVAGKVEKDRSSVGVIFAKEPPKQLAVTRVIGNTYFKIPPGAERHRVTGCWTAQEDIHLHSLTPHMHYRGAAMEYKVFYPDGREEVLLNVPGYDFSWQTRYSFRQPMAIPKGTRFAATQSAAAGRSGADRRWVSDLPTKQLTNFIATSGR